MINVLSSFSVPQLSRVARRLGVSAFALAVAALVVSVLVGHAVFGIGFFLGQALALANFRLIGRTTAKAARSNQSDRRRQIATNSLLRLGAITAVVIGLALLTPELALGTLVALALFQFAMVANVVAVLVRNPLAGDISTGSPLPDDEGQDA